MTSRSSKESNNNILTRLTMTEQQLPQAPQLPPQISEMLTSCFDQMPQIPKCGTMRDIPTEDQPPTGRGIRGAALRNIEIEVGKHLAKAMNQNSFSLITGDEEMTLWSELDLQRSGDESTTSNSYTRDSGLYTDDDTYTQGDTTHADTITVDENNKPQAEESNPDDGIPVVTSVRDRFHYMSAHKKFSNPVAVDPPSDESIIAMKSMQAHEAKNMGGRPNLATLRTSAVPNTQSKGNQSHTSASGANDASVQDKLKRQNELAKQIMRRRANAASNRGALEP
jgi:hypothetical protein